MESQDCEREVIKIIPGKFLDPDIDSGEYWIIILMFQNTDFPFVHLILWYLWLVLKLAKMMD